jgi:hypothetical protein
MKTLTTSKQLLLLIIIFLFCSCDDEYIEFTSDEKDLMVYEQGDQFSFVKDSNKDTIVFEVESKTTTYNQFVNLLSMSTRDRYLPICTIKFINENYNGKIIFLLLEDYCFSSEILINKNTSEIFQGVWGTVKDSVSFFDEFYYSNCDPLSLNECDSLLYSKNKGIVRFTSEKENDVFTLLE